MTAREFWERCRTDPIGKRELNRLAREIRKRRLIHARWEQPLSAADLEALRIAAGLVDLMAPPEKGGA